MHIVHVPVQQRNDGVVKDNNGYIYAVLGVIFDTDPMYAEGYTPEELTIVDQFFDSLNWIVDDKNPKVNEIKF